MEPNATALDCDAGNTTANQEVKRLEGFAFDHLAP
jgi:hypothetical protein